MDEQNNIEAVLEEEVNQDDIDKESDMNQQQLIDSISNFKGKNQIKNQKVFMPNQFSKAKKVLNRLVTEILSQLKDNYLKNKGVFKLYYDELKNVRKSIHQYVRLIKGSEMIPQYIPIVSKIRNKQGIYSYVSQSKKIIHYSSEGKTNLINIQIPQLTQKPPDMATPIPFGDSIYFLDGSYFSTLKKIFLPNNFSYKINILTHKLFQLSVSPRYQRTKCLVLKDQRYIYLMGGMVKEHKIITNSCQCYSPIQNKFIDLPKLNHSHVCPSGCILNNQIWLFSQKAIQVLNLQNENQQCWQWRQFPIPHSSNFYSFQFVHPISQTQIVIFGGLENNRRLTSLQIFNIQHHHINNCGDILPHGICNQRTSGVCVVQNHIVALSSIQASVYPQLGIKSNMLQLLYLGGNNSSYLHTFISI